MTQDQLDDIIEDIMTSTWDSGRTKILNFACFMCDKQKEICYTHALPYKEGAFGNYYYQADIKVEKESVINSPYPDELRENN